MGQGPGRRALQAPQSQIARSWALTCMEAWKWGWYTCCGMVVSTGGHWGGSAACTMNTGKHPPAEHWELGGGWANSAASVASVLVIHITFMVLVLYH